MKKKLLATLLTISIVSAALVGCGGKDNTASDEVATEISTEEAATDGTVEETIEETTAAFETEVSETTDAADEQETEAGTDENADSGAELSGEDVLALYDDIYAGVSADILPANVMTNILDISDIEGITYHTGLTSTDGISEIYLSESMMGSVAYSSVYVRTDGSDVEGIKQQIMENVNPAKWICVTAEKQLIAQIGNDIFFVMGAPETVDAIYSRLEEIIEPTDYEITGKDEKVNAM